MSRVEPWMPGEPAVVIDQRDGADLDGDEPPVGPLRG